MDESLGRFPRANHKALEWINLGSDFRNYMTAALLGWPMAVAYNDWSHVVMLCDAASMPEVALAPGMRLHCYDTLLDDAGDDYVWPGFDENTASAAPLT